MPAKSKPKVGTGLIEEDRLTELVRSNFVLTPKGMIAALNLRRPIYRKTAAFGHFGRSGDGFTWEVADKAQALRAESGVPVALKA